MADLIPAGRYDLEPTHSSLTWRIKHFGLAWYTGRFAKLSGALEFDRLMPEQMRVEAQADLFSVRTDYEGPHGDWDGELARREDLLDAARNPVARFKSSIVRRTGDATADVEGDLHFRGIQRPLTLRTTYNGGLLPHQNPLGQTVIGFSATGLLRRDEFGLTFMAGPLLPNEVQLVIEAEFIRAS